MKSTSGLRLWAVRVRMRSAAKMKLPLRMATATKLLGIVPAISCARESSSAAIASEVKRGSSRAGSTAIRLGQADLDVGRVGRRAFEPRREGLCLMTGKARLVRHHRPAIELTLVLIEDAEAEVRHRQLAIGDVDVLALDHDHRHAVR